MRDPAIRKVDHQRLAGSKSTSGADVVDAIVVAPPDDQIGFLIRELRRTRAQVRLVWPMQETMPSGADVIYCEYIPDLAQRLQWVPGAAAAALVVILPVGGLVNLDALCNATPQCILPRPFSANAIAASFGLALKQFQYEKRLREKIDKLEENLRSTRTIERAKAILMAERGMPEDEAYGLIRRQAMDRRVSAAAVALAIIDSFELLGYQYGSGTRGT
jgi:two-component system, response regulator / RNA-binding antiterminator